MQTVIKMKALLPIILLFSLVTPAKAKRINADLYLWGQINCGELAKYYDEWSKWDRGERADAYKVGYFDAYVIAYVLADWRHRSGDDPMASKEQILHAVGRHAKANNAMWKRGADECVYGALKRGWFN
jgi:hypothetical protein